MSFVSVAYGLSVATIVAFGVGALFLARRRQRFKKDDTEFFLTARHSVPEKTIAWSFYASGVGAWVIFSMPAYVVSAGIIGLIAYSVSCGLPILIVARVGAVLHRKYPGVLSLGDFVQWRFGTIPTIIVTLIMLLNMSIALCAEYTSIGNLMELVVGGSRLPIVLIVAIVTSIYTAAGGLYVSILTDVAQGIFGIGLLIIMAIYVAVTYRPSNLPTPLPEEIGPNYWGFAAIGAMPISMICSTLFSEAPWQRIWASADERALKRGSLWGAMGLVVVCFLYGFGGFLSLWAGYPRSSPDGSTAFFDLLGAGQATAPAWITILAVLSTVTMNEGNVDSLQNGIVDTLASRFFRGKNVWYPRVLVFLINIPVVFVSLKGYNIIMLFLIGNLICTICAVPLLLGLITRLEGYVTAWSMVSGIITGFFSLVAFGYLKIGNVSDGMHYVFMEAYDWPSFILPPIFSCIGVLLAAAIEGVVRKTFGLTYPVPLSFPPQARTEDHENGSISFDDAESGTNSSKAHHGINTSSDK
ncbi:hypothetical protein BX616_000032 [Lobosporangium transversale]|uniref:Sodium:solute symporter family-domain-containing protein n=1 Tax=Lobosporangium transversale TaxID=64571 RepID=A0A1Y2GA56_9FUNG|nr:hypothetical protein BCR41DRAFT_341551 [Lobosporangium transversale]KAF9919179.1 hypothetical protein BX616_000032 [Lobosporangium transversale]ORZ05150.1 hypothetical protein BCR41DRAFT_341551 [Lobosporangium transversale]|eukprot:XP_021876925.1 hypothetical protein BCR41DRAFT_341551 [Lobosporangium transversale]